MLKAFTSTILLFTLLLCSVYADDSLCGTATPKALFTGSLDSGSFSKLAVTFSSSDIVIVPTINPTPSASGKIEVSVSSCISVDVASLLMDLANGADSSLFTLQLNNDPDKTAHPTSAAVRAAPLPLLSVAFVALYLFPKNRLSILALFGALCVVTYAAEPITLYVDISLPASITTVCYNAECVDLSSSTPAPTVAPTAAPTVAPTVVPTGAPTGAPTVVPTIPADISYAFNLRVLVLADKLINLDKMDWGDAEEIPDTLGADWVNATFMSVGMPYDYYPTSTDLTTLLSTTETAGKYSGIVYVKAVSASISTAQQTAITAYQQKYHVKLVVVGSKPANVPGMASAGSASSAAGVVYVAPGFTQYAKTLRAGAQVDVKKVNNWQSSYNKVQPGSISDASIATAALMYKPTSGSEVVAAAAVKVDGVEQLHYFIEQSTANLHSYAMAPLMLNWLSPGGVFMGARRLTFSVQPDDLFLSAFLWDTKNHESSTTATNPPLEYRIVGADLQAAADWLDAKNAELGGESYLSIEWPYNGQGSNAGTLPASDAVFDARFVDTDLFAKTMELYEKFWFISHTWDHPCPNFDTESYDYINKELSYNNIWASNSFLPGGLDNPRMSKECMVSPCITGLHNPNLWAAMANNGIMYQVGDNSEPYKSSPRSNPYRGNWTTMADNGFVGGFIIPREVYAIDVGNSIPEEFTDQWNTENSDAKGTFEEDFVYPVNQGLFNLIAYRQDPHMFHEASVRAFWYNDPVKGNISVSLVTLWMDRVIDQVMTYFDMPIKSPKYSDVADIWVNRMAMDDCLFNAEMLIDANNNLVGFTATSGNSCVAQLTGITLATSETVRMENYGVDTTAYVTMTAGVPQTLYLATAVAL